MASTVRTTCPYCGVGCGVIVTKDQNGAFSVKGDPEHPANFGRLCSKGSALAETLADDSRLLRPIIGETPVNWKAALDLVANEFSKTIEQHGPDSVGFYVSGQLMTEAYYVANKLMKGYIGSANIDTNSRLCMASSVVGHKRAFGSDTVPGTYRDLELADLVVLVGSNLAWCHPVLYQRLAAAKKERGTKVVVIDPRRTATCDIADMHLSINPGSDVLLFNALLSRIASDNRLNPTFAERHTNGLDEALKAANSDAPNLKAVADSCGLPMRDIAQFFDWFCATDKTVTVYSQGVNQSAQGTDKVNAILNCHLLTGRIGRPGCGPFSVTGQPNAMGGREVGGLANTLAAHMDFDTDSIDRVQRFWNAPNMATKPGLKAVDLFDAVHRGKIKALWIMATNPAVSLPDANKVREGLEKCPFVVVSDCISSNDTMQYADVLLPTTTWGERDGTVTNSERRISRQRPFKRAPGDAREDWDIICDVARRMGYKDAFGFETVADIFKEHAQLSAFENDGQRDFDIGGIAHLGPQAYEVLEPFQWPLRSDGKGEQERHFGSGGFYTPDGKGRFIAVSHRLPENLADGRFPFILNTGRTRDQWHTMTRTGLSPRLALHRSEPFLEIGWDDAKTLNLGDGDLAEVSSPQGRMVLRVRLDDGLQPGTVFAPIHWSDANSANGVVGRLIAGATDPYSGQPESKYTPVAIAKFSPKWHALVVSRIKTSGASAEYWASVTGHDCSITTFAGTEDIADWQRWARRMSGDSGHEWLTFSDPSGGRHRFATLKNGRVESAIFVSNHNDLPSLEWAQAQFALDRLDERDRAGLLAGRPANDIFDPGPMVCSCFSVGVNTIRRAIAEQNTLTVEAVGVALQAGTNCGSCKPEIQALLDTELASDGGNMLQQEAS